MLLKIKKNLWSKMAVTLSGLVFLGLWVDTHNFRDGEDTEAQDPCYYYLSGCKGMEWQLVFIKKLAKGVFI